MKREFSLKSSWLMWYDSMKPSKEVKMILDEINKLRTMTTHEKPLKTFLNIESSIELDSLPIEIVEEIKHMKDKNIDAYIHEEDAAGNQYFEFQVHGKKVRGKILKVARTVNEIEEDIYKLCFKYYKIIEKFAKEAVEKYFSL